MRAPDVGRAILLVAILAIAFLSGIWFGTSLTQPAISQSQAQVCYSPRHDCASIVMHWITEARTSVHVLMFTFTLQQLADALIEAKNRGVDVRVVLERNQDANEAVRSRLLAAGVEVRMDNNEALMHDKIAILDSKVVLTGSFNWTESANNSNNENLLVISDLILAQSYEAQFEAIWNESSGSS